MKILLLLLLLLLVILILLMCNNINVCIINDNESNINDIINEN